MSVFKIRSTDQMNTHNSIKNPARVSCSTNPCIWRPFRPDVPPVPAVRTISATSRYLDGVSGGEKLGSLSPMGSVNSDDDLGVAQADYVAVGQLPLLYRCVVNSGAVCGVQVRQQRDLAIPTDLEVAARHSGVGQPELGVLAATDDVGALAQLIGAAAAVVELQGDRGSGGGIAALRVGAEATAGLLGVVGGL